jgi:hypothetical protein
MKRRLLSLFRALLGSPPRLTPELKDLVELANKMVRQVKRDFYSLGVVWNRLVEKSDARTAESIWGNYVDGQVSIREAQNYGQLAREYSADTVSSTSIFNLLLCSRYCHQHGIAVPKDPASLIIEWTEADGTQVRKAFSECTYVDLQKAVGRARPPRPPHPRGGDSKEPAIPDDYKKIWDYLQGKVHDTLEQDPEALFELHMVGERKARVHIDVEEEILVDLAQAIVDAAQGYSPRQERPKPNSIVTKAARRTTRQARR